MDPEANLVVEKLLNLSFGFFFVFLFLYFWVENVHNLGLELGSLPQSNSTLLPVSQASMTCVEVNV